MSLKKLSLVAFATFAFASVGLAHNKQGCHAVIKFDKGQDQLTQAAKNSLASMIDKASSQGQIATVEVAAWSDTPSAARNQDLSVADRDLAERRATNVQSYLKDTLNVSSVKTFNMAEGSNWLSRTFRTDNAELKSVFSKNEAPIMSRSDFNIIREDGGASKAAVVISKKMLNDTSATDAEPEDIN